MTSIMIPEYRAWRSRLARWAAIMIATIMVVAIAHAQVCPTVSFWAPTPLSVLAPSPGTRGMTIHTRYARRELPARRWLAHRLAALASYDRQIERRVESGASLEAVAAAVRESARLGGDTEQFVVKHEWTRRHGGHRRVD